MPRKPPTLEDLIDQLADAAANYAKDLLGDVLPQYHIPRHPIPDRRVKGTSKGGQKGRKGGQEASRPSPRTQTRAGRVRTAYAVLGVDPGADDDVIKMAYRIMCVKLHPDKPENRGKEHLMQELNAAWEILKDPKKKAAYDRGIGL